MLAKTTFFTLLAACAIASGASGTVDNPSEKQPPPEQPLEDQHFCCTDIDTNNWTGEGCVAISKENINSCNTVLYCPGKWGKKDGNVTCE